MVGPSYQLVMQTGPNQGKVAPLEKNEIFVGRDISNDIVINDPEVSRRHARMVLQAGGFVIEDLGSTNGTSVNGQRLMGPYILRPGDVITLGEHVNISFEPVAFDPDATVAAVPARPAVNIPTPPPPPHPVERQASPVFAGQVPYSPGPAEAFPAEPVMRRRQAPLWAVTAAVVVALACICGLALWIIDTNFLWCTLFPFLAGCP